MSDKRSRVKKVIIGVAVLGALLAGYFYLPSIFGDSVFPLKYADSIKRWSKEYNEDPFLVASILMLESGFNPQAVSPVGALGIAQIMPPTGRTIASGVGMTNFTTNDLYNPEIGIQFCTWHIHVLKEKYGGNEIAALAAYNAGSGNADKWIRAGLLNNPNDNSYARKVLGYKDVYHKLYQSQLELSASVSTAPSEPTKPIVKVNDTPTRNIVWGQVLKNLVTVFYSTEEDK
ncbi:MAG: lytic transglycosylase domain-containing protein [Patescibacteria group bacterium]|jgi:soluble lytic murein transglycosylase